MGQWSGGRGVLGGCDAKTGESGCGEAFIDKLKTIAELARLSNLPTVWSNVLVGFIAGLAVMQRQPVTGDEAVIIPGDAAVLTDVGFITGFVLLAVFGSCFYAAGMVLNDVADAGIDASQRPDRPIPSGRIDRWAALGVSVVLLAFGCAALWPFEPNRERVFALAGLLAVSIIAYNLLHKRSAFAVLFMGVCRALLVIIAASVWNGAGTGQTGIADWWRVVGPISATLFLYTIAITIIARIEHRDRQDARRYLSLVMIPLVLSPALLIPGEMRAWAPSLIAAALVTLWLLAASSMIITDPPRTRHAVMAWLAGMCLIDVWFITLLGRPLVAAIAAACFIITALGHRRISGT